MSIKMRGVFNSLRYISGIFDKENEKEKEKEKEEMQIGLPTDVKHVSHMGSDGAAGTANTWINAGSADTKDKSSTNDPPNSTDLAVTGPVSDNLTRPKQSRRHNSSSGLDGTSRDPTQVKPRRNKSSNLESSSRDAINRPRRRKNSSIGSETNSDTESVSRRERSQRRKSKDMTSGSGSDTGHDPSAEYGSDTGEIRRPRTKTKSKDMNKTSVSERREEEEGNVTDDLSREIGAL